MHVTLRFLRLSLWGRYRYVAQERQLKTFRNFQILGACFIIMPCQATVFIDNGYLAKTLENDFGRTRLDYYAFANELCARISCELANAYLYDAPPINRPTDNAKRRKAYANRMRFFDDIRKTPRFEVKLGRLSEHIDHETGRLITRQKGVDVMLAIDMVIHTLDPELMTDNLILIAGDADFEPAVKYTVARGKNTVLCCSMKSRKNGGQIILRCFAERLQFVHSA